MTIAEPPPKAVAQATPALSVVIPVHNDKAHLERCLDALSKSRYEAYEVIVMDDASTDDTADAAEEAGARLFRLDQNMGPAAARNLGAQEARGDLLLFIDADVCVAPETICGVIESFDNNPGIDAVFGSYDHEPEHRGLFSQYRNLMHHFVHQSSDPDASTFWSGCGAIRKSVFLEHGGFDPNYARPCIEDIELGIRLAKAGHRIMLNGKIQATHLKHWTLWKMIKTDIFDRGVPWTRLMLAHGSMPNDLNLRISQRISALLALCFLTVQVVAAFYQPFTLLFPVLGFLGVLAADSWRVRTYTHKPAKRTFEFLLLAGIVMLSYLCGWWSGLIAAPLIAIILLNLRFYRFLVEQRSLTFAIFIMPLHVLYYLYSVLAYGIGVISYVRDQIRGQGKPIASPTQTTSSIG